MSIYTATSEAEVALSTGTTRTIIQLAGVATTKSRLVAWGISFDGTDSTIAPSQVDLVRQSTAGTSSAASALPMDTSDAAATSGVRKGFSSTEPTTVAVLESYEIHPQGGMMIREYPPGREPVIAAATTDRIGIRVNAAQAVNAIAWVQWDE